MSMKTLSAKFRPETVEAVKRKCKLLNCSKSTYLRWCVIRTNVFINSLVYRTRSQKIENLGVEGLEKELAKAMGDLEVLMNKNVEDKKKDELQSGV